MNADKYLLLYGAFVIFIIIGGGFLAMSWETKQKAQIEIEAIKAGLVQDIKDGEVIWIEKPKEK